MKRVKIFSFSLILLGVTFQSHIVLGDDIFDPRFRCSTQIVPCGPQKLESRCVTSDMVSSDFALSSGYQQCCFRPIFPDGFRRSCTLPQCKHTVTSECQYGCNLKTKTCATSFYTDLAPQNQIDLLVCQDTSGGLLSQCSVYDKSFVAKESFPSKVTFKNREYHFESLLQNQGFNLEVDADGNKREFTVSGFGPVVDLNIDWSKQSSCYLWDNGTHGLYSVDLNDPRAIREVDGRFLAIGDFDYKVPFDTYNKGMLRIKADSGSNLTIEVGFQVNERFKTQQLEKELSQGYLAGGTSGVWDTIIDLGLEVLSSESKLLVENDQVAPHTFSEASIGTKRFIVSMVQIADQKSLISVDSSNYWSEFLDNVGCYDTLDNCAVPLDNNHPNPSAPFEAYYNYNPNLNTHLYLPNEILLPEASVGIPADCHMNLSDVQIVFDRNLLLFDVDALAFPYIIAQQRIADAESFHNYYIGGEDGFWGAILTLAESLREAQEQEQGSPVLSWDDIHFMTRLDIEDAIDNAIENDLITSNYSDTWELFKEKAVCYGPGGTCNRPTTEGVSYEPFVAEDGSITSVRGYENAATYFREKRNMEKITGAVLLIQEIANRYGYDVSEHLDWFFQDQQ